MNGAMKASYVVKVRLERREAKVRTIFASAVCLKQKLLVN